MRKIIVTFLAVLLAAIFGLFYYNSHITRRTDAVKLQVLNLIEAGDYVAAEWVLTNAEARLDSHDFDLFVLKGDVFAGSGRFEESTQAYEEALRLKRLHSKKDKVADTIILERKLAAVRNGRKWTKEELFRRGSREGKQNDETPVAQ